MNDYWYHPYHNLIAYVFQIRPNWNFKFWAIETPLPLNDVVEQNSLGLNKAQAEKQLRDHGWIPMDEYANVV